MSRFKKGFLFFLIIVFIWTGLPVKASAELRIASYSAIIMDQKTGRVFYEKNAHTPRKIASITKIMTAIIAIESGKMDELVTVTSRAVNTEGSSIYLKPGEKIKLEHLVYGLMLRSGNDAAVAIAEHVGGSLEGFVYLMNEKAAQLGMVNTNFTNPHGLDDSEDHYSTAYDMAILTRYAMQNETFRKISGTRVHHAPNPDSQWDRKWSNKHRLVRGMYKYTTGGKTGYTKLAKRSLVTTAKKNGMELIAVTLNSETTNDWNEHIQMFEHVFSNYQYERVLKEGPIDVINEEIYKNRAYLPHDYHYPITSDEKDLFKVHYRIEKPKKSWTRHPEQIPEVIGKAEIYFDEELVDVIPVYFKYEGEKKKSFFEYVREIFGAIIGVKIDD